MVNLTNTEIEKIIKNRMENLKITQNYRKNIYYYDIFYI